MSQTTYFPPREFTPYQRAAIERLSGLTAVQIEVFLSDMKTRAVTRTIDDAVRNAVMNAGQAQFLRDAIASRSSILITGRTSAGKTWIQQAIANEVALAFPGETVRIIDDHAELYASHDNHEIELALDGGVELAATVARASKENVRHVVLGELRHAEVLPELATLATSGAQVIATFYCHDAARLQKDLSPYAGIAEAKRLLHAVGLVVHMEQHRVARVSRIDYLSTNGL
ncbi:ATPase, T2SS/T4P/T4SS family [Paraburkholderia youngii]|uniref:ATPase, T2SS/T4P/T4SS family n=1 Tax=Paraburkholderia youngii TaxID=2782701 RepID=UPI003D1D48AE